MVVRAVVAFVREERGAIAVEFALMLPLLVTLFLSMADLGLAINQRMKMQHILRIAAQVAMRGGSLAEVDATLQAAREELATPRMSQLSILEPRIDWRCGTRSVSRRSSCGGGREPSAVVVMEAVLPYRSILFREQLGVDIEAVLEVEVPLNWREDRD